MHITNQILDLSILKQFGISSRIGRVLSPVQVFWHFSAKGTPSFDCFWRYFQEQL